MCCFSVTSESALVAFALSHLSLSSFLLWLCTIVVVVFFFFFLCVVYYSKLLPYLFHAMRWKKKKKKKKFFKFSLLESFVTVFVCFSWKRRKRTSVNTSFLSDANAVKRCIIATVAVALLFFFLGGVPQLPKRWPFRMYLVQCASFTRGTTHLSLFCCCCCHVQIGRKKG